MKRFGEWQMKTYRPPGWHKEIFAGAILHGKNGENRRALDKWVSGRGIRMGGEGNPENEFLDRPDKAAKTLCRLCRWDERGLVPFPALWTNGARKGRGRDGRLEEQLQEITTS